MIQSGVPALICMLIKPVSLNLNSTESRSQIDHSHHISLGAVCILAVNVNIWLSLDDANLNETSGGLVVYTTKPPGEPVSTMFIPYRS